MEVVVARTAGFCWGVRRAMDAVLDASGKKRGRVQTLGPLIHNPQALTLLNQRGVSIVDTPDEVSSGTVLVRAHGIPIQDLKKLKARQSEGEIFVINATCPEVAKVHSRIKKWSARGYFTIILGTHGHAESLAHRSFAQAGSAIVANLLEARAIPPEQLKKVFVVAQTTFTNKDFNLIVDELKSSAEEIVVENTICEDTRRRQEEAERIATNVDYVVVVGGKNSSNTKHLAFLAQKNNKPVQFVEIASEIDLGAFRGDEIVGVLAGASTPTWLVDDVVDVLQQHGSRPAKLRELFEEPLLSPILLCLGISVMAIGIHTCMGLVRDWTSVFILFAYSLAMYLAQPYLDPFGLGSKGPARGRYLERHRRLLISLAGIALLVAVALGMAQGRGYTFAVVGASVLGLSYKLRVQIFHKSYSLRAIPGSKDILITLALAIIGIVLPAWQQDHSWGWQSIGSLLFAGALVFARSIIVSLSDMQKDQIMGHETLPILLGRNKSQFMMYAMLAFALCFNAVMAYQTMNIKLLVVLTICTIYPIVYHWVYRIRFSAERPRFDPGVEPAFFLVGIMALV
ncbi:MAG: 4-hydroxy-3-methylbut-2-enyl diphosphate reductase [Holophagaceae bacterium]|nr:4-hydroxy-3-methylbut-2-enyl diphosphate reductase [Holophagaceae bacterium]